MPDEAQQDQRAKAKMLKTVRGVLLAVLLIALVLAIWGIASRLNARTELRKTTSNNAELTVVTVKPTLSDAGDELVLPGNIQAFIEAPIYARTNGYLKTWYTDIGTRVHKGQLLAEIDAPEVDRQLAQARADLETARANATLAKTTNIRWQNLAKTQAVSQQDADEKSGDAAAKTAAQDSAEQNLARLQDLESFKRVLAPFDGVVTARNTDIGALINAGEATNAELFRVADISKLRVYAQVPQAFATATKTGLNAELRFAEKPGQSYTAKAIRTSRALDPASRTLQVELQLDNRNGDLFPGAYTEIHFKLPSASKTLRVPSNTVLFRAQGLQVATVDGSRKIKMKNIIQGRDFGQTIEILDGIDPQDNIVVNPSDSIDDGIAVRIAPPANNSGKQDSANAAGQQQDTQSKESTL